MIGDTATTRLRISYGETPKPVGPISLIVRDIRTGQELLAVGPDISFIRKQIEQSERMDALSQPKNPEEGGRCEMLSQKVDKALTELLHAGPFTASERKKLTLFVLEMTSDASERPDEPRSFEQWCRDNEYTWPPEMRQAPNEWAHQSATILGAWANYLGSYERQQESGR